MGAVRAYVRRSQRTIKRATLHLSKCYHDEILKYIVSRCKVLQRIDVVSGFAGNTILRAAPLAIELKTLILDCYVTMDTMCQLLVDCSNLERAEFHKVHCTGRTASWQGNMTRIRSLLINVPGHEPGTGLVSKSLPELYITIQLRYQNTSALLEKIPNAQNLTLKNWHWTLPSSNHWDFSVTPKLQSLDMTNNQHIIFPRLPPSLHTLDLSSCIAAPQLDDLSHDNVVRSSLPEMKSLSLSNYHSMEPTRLMALLSRGKGKLELLNLKNCNLQAQNINSLIQDGFLTDVIQLGLAGLPVNDTCVELLATNLHLLKYLDLSFTRVTGVGVKALVLKSGVRLERLNLMMCSQVNVDAVTFARSHGIQITYSFPENRMLRK